MRKIYQKNISGVKNADKGIFDALTATCAETEKWLEFPVTTIGNEGMETVGYNSLTAHSCDLQGVTAKGYYQPSRRFLLRRGFTLIELLVVVLIIGILAAVALPRYRLAVARSYVAEALSVGRSLQEARTRYYLANGTLNTDWEDLDVQPPAEQKNITYEIHSSYIYSFWACIVSVPGLKIEFPGDGAIWCMSYGTLPDKVCATYGPVDHSGADGTKYVRIK